MDVLYGRPLTENASSQADIDCISEMLSEVYIDAALEVGACKPPVVKAPENSKRASKVNGEYKPWFDLSCRDERSSYFAAKNASKRRGEKATSNKLSKDFQKFLKSKRRDFTQEINKKIKNLKSVSPKDYWNILNGSAEGKKVK